MSGRSGTEEVLVISISLKDLDNFVKSSRRNGKIVLKYN